MHIGTYNIAASPAVVGTVSSPTSLAALGGDAVLDADIIELRYDLLHMPEADIRAACERLRSAGVPMILTVRSTAEAWQEAGQGTDEDPAAVYTALADVVDAVDLEWESPSRDSIDKALPQDIVRIVSRHDFEGVPELEEVGEIIAAVTGRVDVIVKVAAMIMKDEDVDRLAGLLKGRPHDVPLCVIGMGEKGVSTRLEFPGLGSCLTYGYMDEAAAPGQISCRTLKRHLMDALPAYRAAHTDR